MQGPQQDHGEQEREPGLGGRVRRFVESELGRVLDKSDRPSGEEQAQPVPPAEPDAGRAPVVTEASAAPVGLLNDVVALREQWQGIQTRFVDDPQRAVHDAAQLVKRTLGEIRMNVESEQPSDTMSTDELRVSFRRYREFFQRLLSA